MRLRSVLLLSLLMTFIFVLFFLIRWLLPHPREDELRAAYERSTRILQEARTTGNLSRLSEGFTEQNIADLESTFRFTSSNVSLYQDVRVDWIDVVEYNPPEAIIIVRASTASPVYNPGTNRYDKWERNYMVIKYRMYQEDGVWKLDDMLDLLSHGPG